MVLNLQDWRGDLSTLQKQFDDWPVPALKELVAVTRSGTIVQIVRRDRGRPSTCPSPTD
ncbi:hypothetical protein KBX06_20950 [Micromonospora sp. C31]|nr:hypothetical protein [Micromonospora sp. C31]